MVFRHRAGSYCSRGHVSASAQRIDFSATPESWCFYKQGYSPASSFLSVARKTQRIYKRTRTLLSFWYVRIWNCWDDLSLWYANFFFFQAEDGIRDGWQAHGFTCLQW